MARSNVPQFGNWDTENISYTTYFENARKPSSNDKTNPKHERKLSQEDYESQRQADGGRRVSGGTPKRASRSNGAGVRSVDQSPLHPHYQAKVASKGSGISSPWEKRGSYDGIHTLAPSTPGRSRLKSVPRGNETFVIMQPERGTAVPKFGEWDESDPSSADGFSHIFSKVKEERHACVGNAPGGSTQTKRSVGYSSKDSKGCCCFPWGKN